MAHVTRRQLKTSVKQKLHIIFCFMFCAQSSCIVNLQCQKYKYFILQYFASILRPYRPYRSFCFYYPDFSDSQILCSLFRRQICLQRNNQLLHFLSFFITYLRKCMLGVIIWRFTRISSNMQLKEECLELHKSS